MFLAPKIYCVVYIDVFCSKSAITPEFFLRPLCGLLLIVSSHSDLKVLKGAWKMGCHLVHRSTISEFSFVWFPPGNRV
jgi:hypothetical protein